jgi:methyl-accepting chemotaxis protein
VNRQTGEILLNLSDRITRLTDSLQEVSGKMGQLNDSSNEILDVMKDNLTGPVE